MTGGVYDGFFYFIRFRRSSQDVYKRQTEKIEADFYTQDVAGAKPQEPPENKTPVATKITGKMLSLIHI